MTFLHIPSYGQESSHGDTLKAKSVEEAINNSLKKFRQGVEQNAVIYTFVNFDINNKSINLSKNDFIVKNDIDIMNPSKIDYKTIKYVIWFVVSINKGRVFVKVIQFRLKKTSNKAIDYINLMSGYFYEIVPD